MTVEMDLMTVGEERPLNRHLFAVDVNRDAATLHCPVCDFEYTHIEEVFTRLPGGSAPDSAEAYPGTIAKDVDRRWRRPGVVLVFNCESSHRFELVIQQHKGMNFCWVKRIDDMPPADDADD